MMHSLADDKLSPRGSFFYPWSGWNDYFEVDHALALESILVIERPFEVIIVIVDSWLRVGGYHISQRAGDFDKG